MKKADIILIAAVLFLAAAIFITQNAEKGNSASHILVTADGELLGEFPLEKDLVLPISTPYGENLLVIENGAARVMKADCTNQNCVETGAVESPGEIIVCLPHKVMITVISGEEEGYDAIAK